MWLLDTDERGKSASKRHRKCPVNSLKIDYPNLWHLQLPHLLPLHFSHLRPPPPSHKRAKQKKKYQKRKTFSMTRSPINKNHKNSSCVCFIQILFFHFYFNWVMWKGGSDAAWGWRIRPERGKKWKLIEFRKNNTPREKGKHTKLRTPPVPHSVIYQHARNCRKKNFRRFFFFVCPGCILKYALLHYRKVFGAFLGKF